MKMATSSSALGFNPKCVAFSALMMIFYWVVSRQKNPYVLPVIAIVAYVAMAAYDTYFHCDGQVPPPQTDAQRDSYLRWVYLIHVVIVGPLLIYAGWKGVNGDTRVFGALLALGLVATLYHGAKLLQKPRVGNEIV